MSLSKLEKYLDKPFQTSKVQSKHAILISSSKGNYVKPHVDILNSVGFDLEFVCRGGATFPAQYYWLVRNLSAKVKIYDQIVIFVWLGTCDLTKKKGSFISLQHGTDEEAVSYLTNQIQNFCSFAARFPSVKLVFLEIPPYSIVEWNRCKGHHSPLDFQEQDVSLSTRIILVNEVLRQINDSRNFTSPLFRLDLTRYRKSWGGFQRKFLNFDLYKDGIHPTDTLARYWMKRIASKILLLC